MSDDKENIEQEKVNKKSWWKKVVGFKPNLRTVQMQALAQTNLYLQTHAR